MNSVNSQKLNAKKAVQVVKKAVKEVLTQQGIEASTRKGNKELDLFLKKLLKGEYTNEGQLRAMGAGLGKTIATVSEQRGVKHLDKQVILQVALKEEITIPEPIPTTPAPKIAKQAPTLVELNRTPPVKQEAQAVTPAVAASEPEEEEEEETPAVAASEPEEEEEEETPAVAASEPEEEEEEETPAVAESEPEEEEEEETPAVAASEPEEEEEEETPAVAASEPEEEEEEETPAVAESEPEEEEEEETPAVAASEPEEEEEEETPAVAASEPEEEEEEETPAVAASEPEEEEEEETPAVAESEPEEEEETPAVAESEPEEEEEEETPAVAESEPEEEEEEETPAVAESEPEEEEEEETPAVAESEPEEEEEEETPAVAESEPEEEEEIAKKPSASVSLKDRIAEDIKLAMKAKDTIRLETVRGIKKAIIEKEVAVRPTGQETLTPEQELEILSQQAKQRRDSIEQYQKAQREDLADKEAQELAIIETYLPKQLTDEELQTILAEIIASTGANSAKDLGKVMGVAMQQLKGKADGKKIQELVKSQLN
jgi:uncharacterized protein YqeY